MNFVCFFDTHTKHTGRQTIIIIMLVRWAVRAFSSIRDIMFRDWIELLLF